MTLKTKIFSVAGLNADPAKNLYVQKLMKEITEKPETKLDIKLVPEPDNPYDPLAIAVTVNGEPIGFIAKTDQGELKHPVEEREIVIFSWGYGGNYNEFVYCNLEIS